MGFSKLLAYKYTIHFFLGLEAAANYVIIGYMAILFFALTGAKSNSKDKIRFIKSFLNINPLVNIHTLV